MNRLFRFRSRTLLMASATLAVLLLAIVLIPQFAAGYDRLQSLRRHLDETARLAASQVDGDLHRQLLAGTADEATLARARAPLLRLHENWPEAVYLYTMGIGEDGAFFVLDTAQDTVFADRNGLSPSAYMEPFEQRAEYRDSWLERLAAGSTYVTPDFQSDDFGTFLSGHAPIFDSERRVTGFVGVDFSVDYYFRDEARFRRIEIASALVALLMSLVLGYLFARRDFAQEAELLHHFRRSMQDPLTGLPNRRAAMAAIEDLWQVPDADTHAALLIDLDHFKQINDNHGHQAGDQVLRTLARALRGSVRPGDLTVRLGGDEFMIFARNCDLAGAEQIAARVLAAVHAAREPVAFHVTVGYAIASVAKGSFEELYRHADAALYRAKEQGRNRYAAYTDAVMEQG